MILFIGREKAPQLQQALCEKAIAPLSNSWTNCD